MKEKIQFVVSRLLLTFTLVSLGFLWGKHSSVNESADTQTNAGDYVQVYYMHGTFRCVTCNTIERMTRELLDSNYAKQLAGNKVQWKEVNFQENTELAKQFDVIASCVVVANVKEGKISEFKRLDDVWTKMESSSEFNNYVGNAVNVYLGEGTAL